MRSTSGFTKSCLGSVSPPSIATFTVSSTRVRFAPSFWTTQGARFDPETSQHDHFVCERCGRVVDLFLRQARPVDLSSLAKQGYVVTTHTLTVHGMCQVCAARRRTSRSQRPARRLRKGRPRKGRCEMMPDPTPPYRVPDFCPDCREKFLAVVGWIAPALESTLSPAPPEPITTPEDTLRRAGISSERQAGISGGCRACWRGG